MSDALSKVFDVMPRSVEIVTSDNNSITVPPDGAEDVDHAFARAKHYEISEAGSEAIGIAMRIARETENPKAIEALSGLLKNLADVNKSLLTLNKDKSDAKTAKGGKGAMSVQTPQTIGTAVQNNIIFAGSSSDLNKLIAEQMKGSK